jgi:hypothetical protein
MCAIGFSSDNRGQLVTVVTIEVIQFESWIHDTYFPMSALRAESAC